jgi:acetyl esterase
MQLNILPRIGHPYALSLTIILLALTTLTSCIKDPFESDSYYDRIKPTGPKPAWGPSITKQMLAVVETLDSIAEPIHELTPQEARDQPSAADAAELVMQKFHIPKSPMFADTIGKEIPLNGGGSIHARIYTPKTGKSSYPVIVYYHGGGWVIATIDTYHESALALAEKADAIVVSVEYRKGPEFKFPIAHRDAFTAYRWIQRNATTFKGDPTRVAAAGESAGGNLAINIGVWSRDQGVRPPTHILAVYPVASNDPNTPSKLKYVDALPLSTPDLPWFLNHYLNNDRESSNPLITLLNADLKNLAPTTIIAAELDPLLSEGKMLKEKLQASGVHTKYKLYTGVTHEFFGMAGVLREARDAQIFAAEELKKSFR